MTLPRLKEMSAYWNQYPPTHVVTAWHSGWKPAEKEGIKGNGGENLPEFALLPDEEE